MTIRFDGSREDLEMFLRTLPPEGFYVYLLCRPDRSPFYVGKGSNRRVFEHEKEAMQAHPIGETNPFKCNVIRKLKNSHQSIHYRIDNVYSSDEEKECLDRESSLIKELGRLHEGGILTNLASGTGNASGSSPYSVKKHARTLSGEPENNPERAIINSFLQSVGPVASVPVKPIKQISRILPSKPHTQSRKPTERCAYALMASASANGLRFEPGVEIPRAFVYEGVKAVIENGVSRDLLKACMANLINSEHPEDEKYNLNEQQCNIMKELVGAENLLIRGLL